MADSQPNNPDLSGDPPRRGLAAALVKLARPQQWAKSAFVLVGPVYGFHDAHLSPGEAAWKGLLAAAAFALASSASYIVNDVADADVDRKHPRKRLRPIARGEVSTRAAMGFAAALLVGVAVLLLMVKSIGLAGLVVMYVLNVWLYSMRLKHIVVADVISLSLGFVLRVLGGCAALEITPSTWLLNVTLFLAMFLAFGKRLGERRTLGAGGAAAARGVQAAYSDALLRMFVIATAVATLITYAGYVQAREPVASHVFWGVRGAFNVLWFTLLPATYAMLRSIVLVEHGRYDDPTELAMKDWPTQLAALAFVGLTGVSLAWRFLFGTP
ncbi:MAG: decaprenyl-phosphate phosphoribosyltransferase [Tepidisphaera sp.]|nr:decaprenyl-phosphate phosphoribosyltransferase [Tepidisphaera sp.]